MPCKSSSSDTLLYRLLEQYAEEAFSPEDAAAMTTTTVKLPVVCRDGRKLGVEPVVLAAVSSIGMQLHLHDAVIVPDLDREDLILFLKSLFIKATKRTWKKLEKVARLVHSLFDLNGEKNIILHYHISVHKL